MTKDISDLFDKGEIEFTHDDLIKMGLRKVFDDSPVHVYQCGEHPDVETYCMVMNEYGVMTHYNYKQNVDYKRGNGDDGRKV